MAYLRYFFYLKLKDFGFTAMLNKKNPHIGLIKLFNDQHEFCGLCRAACTVCCLPESRVKVTE